MSEPLSNTRPDELSDPKLIQAVLAGGSEGFGELVIRHDATVRGAVAAVTLDVGIQEDAIQDTWFQVYRKLGDLVDAAKIKPWLKVIARRCALDHHQRAQRIRTALTLGVDGIDCDTEMRQDESQGLEWIWRIVNKLPKSSATLLREHYQEGLSYLEMATRHKTSRDTIRGRIYRARQELSRCLEAEKDHG